MNTQYPTGNIQLPRRDPSSLDVSYWILDIDLFNPMEPQMKVAAAKVKTKDGEFIFVDMNRGDEMSQDHISEFLKRKFPDKPVLYRERFMIGGSVQYSGHTQFVEHVRTVPLNSFRWKMYKVWE